MRKKIAVLGSTGSIGRGALKIASLHKERIEIVALAARGNIDLLERQVKEHSPKIVAVFDPRQAALLQKKIAPVPVVAGIEGLCEAATLAEAETVLAAVVGAIGLIPTVSAIRAGKTIALANKEVLVSAGGYIMPLVKEKGVPLLPVDSEHNAVFQCLKEEKQKAVKRIVLTGSGGPFRGYTKERLLTVTKEEALKHPNFSMGSKITVDSSTLMNKGLEVIEASWLFDLPPDKIEVVIHPEQKIHGAVEFVDGSILAQMCNPDMLVPIQYAITYPERVSGPLTPYDFVKEGALHFEAPDTRNFGCLPLAYACLRAGGTAAAYMNGANEALVAAFLRGEISWVDIYGTLARLLDRYQNGFELSLESILEADGAGRRAASEVSR